MTRRTGARGLALSDVTATTPAPLSGHQIELRLGDQEATVTDVGAKLRR